MAATLDHVVEQLSRIAQQLNVVVGVDSQYDRTNKEQKEKKEKSIKSNLDTTEKERYKNIAKQFESVLGFNMLKDTLKQLNRSLSDQQKTKKEEERSSHISRHRYTPAVTAADKKEAAGSLPTLLKALGLGSLLALLGGVGALMTNILKIGPEYGILHVLYKYTTMTGLKVIVSAVTKFFSFITAPFKFLFHIFTEQAPKLLSMVSNAFSKFNKNIIGKLPQTISKFLIRGDTLTKSLSNTFTLGLETLMHSFPKFFQFLEKGKTFLKPITSVLGKGSKFLIDKLPKLFSFLGKGLKGLKLVPGIGSLISFYYAYDRFKKGDITGGFVDIASGIASLGSMFPPAYPIATGIAIGLDMVNLWRDLTGRSEAEAARQSPTKTWLKEKMEKLGDFITEKCYDWPVIGPAIRAYQHFEAGRWLDGINSLSHAIPIVGQILDFFVKEKDPTTGKTYTGRTFADVVKDCFNWLFDGNDSKFFDKKEGEKVSSTIKDKISSLIGRIKDFIVSVVSGAGDILKGLMSTDSDMSMKYINVVTTIKPSLDKLNKELQLAISSSLKEQLNAMSQVEAVLYMQKDILEDNRSLLREIVINTRTNTNQPQLLSTNSPLPSFREERSFTRTSYINDVRSMNAVVRESLA